MRKPLCDRLPARARYRAVLDDLCDVLGQSRSKPGDQLRVDLGKLLKLRWYCAVNARI